MAPSDPMGPAGGREGGNGVALLERGTLRLLEVNPAFCKLTGYSADALQMHTLLDLLAGAKGALDMGELRDAARSGRPMPVRILRRGGAAEPGQLSFSVRGEGSAAKMFAVIIPTGRADSRTSATVVADEPPEKAIARLQKECARLTEVLGARDKLLATLAHELRTPLASVRSFAELLVEKQSDPESRREASEVISRESERMVHLLDELLDLSRVEAGRRDLEPVEFDVRDLVNETIAAGHGPAKAKGVRLTGSLGGQPRFAFGDRAKLQRVLGNLLANAVKFSPRGAAVEVRVRDGSEAGRVEIDVCDAGVGVAEEDRERIFEPFYRSASAGGVPGAGLGLALARELLELHGGRIWVDPRDGGGSNFRVEIPSPDEVRGLLKQAKAEPAPPQAEEEDDSESRSVTLTEAHRLPPLMGGGARPAAAGGLRADSIPPVGGDREGGGRGGLRGDSLPPLGGR